MPESISNPFGFTLDPIIITATARAGQGVVKGDTYIITRTTAAPGKGLNTTSQVSIVDPASGVAAVALETAAAGRPAKFMVRGEVFARVTFVASTVTLANNVLVSSAYRAGHAGTDIDALMSVADFNTPSTVSFATPRILALMVDARHDSADGAVPSTASGLRQVMFDGINGFGSVQL